MREIKFRLWDKKNKLMWTHDYPTGPGTYWHIGNNNYTDVTENNVCRDSEDFIVMQFTGLKDKNGKGIYEGDILYVMGSGNCPVKFYDGSFVVWEGYNAWTSFTDDLEGDISMEVIGNIYENPGLSDVSVATGEGGSGGN